MSTTSTEVLIVGAGVIGSSIAYHLARQGRRVLVVERSEVAASPAASWASAGGVRRQGRHPAEAKLAIEAIERWKTLEQELEADLHYRRGGNLLLAESDAEADQLSKFVVKRVSSLLSSEIHHARMPSSNATPRLRINLSSSTETDGCSPLLFNRYGRRSSNRLA